MELRELLTKYEFPGDEIPIVRGSALKALESDDVKSEDAKPIFELMDAIDTYIPEPVRDTDKPFLMPIEDVFSISGRGTVVTGRVERGVIKVGEDVEIVGIRADDEDGLHRGGDVPEDPGSGSGWGQYRGAAEGDEAGRGGARAGGGGARSRLRRTRSSRRRRTF